MLRDVFYYGSKPNVHPRERFAENLGDARQKCTTDHFWIINEFCDYRNFDWDFDFEFLPDEDVWAEEHNNVWPSQHQKDSGTWLCPKEHSDLVIYRGDVDPVYRKNEKQSDNWVELDSIDHTKFDFSWHPDPSAPPYIYKWGCKFYPAELKHVLEYRVPGATQEKYMNTIAELLPNNDLWVEHYPIDKNKFDMSWRPDPMDPPYIYVWGNKYFDGTIKPTLEYRVPGATEIKYVNEVVDLLPDMSKFEIKLNVDRSKFDFSWVPNPTEPDFIYVWGNKHNRGEVEPTVIYAVPGATEYKYMPEPVELLPNMSKFELLLNVDTTKFDFTWRPDPKSPPYIYVWGNKYNIAEVEPTIRYVVDGATEYKYMSEPVELLPDMSKFEVLLDVDTTKFDLTWRPNPTSPPYIYVWGNQLYSAEVEPTIRYAVEGATEYKYMSEPAIVRPDMKNYKINYPIVDGSFDFSWRPHPNDPPFIYRFGANLHPVEIMPVIEYIVPGATEYKYLDAKAKLAANMENWEIPNGIKINTFDFSWYPDPTSPPYIYQFGTTLDNNDGPRYVTPNNNGEVVYLKRIEIAKEDIVEVKQYYIETTLDDLVESHPNEVFWAMRKNIDYSHFDFDWRPGTVGVAWELNYVHVFGTMESDITQTYFVSAKNYLSGNKDFKFVDVRNLDESNLSELFVKPNMFFIDKGNPDATARYELLKAKFGDRIQKTRYINSWVDTINRCAAKSNTELLWVLNSELDYSEFDFNYYPNPWQMNMVHVFGTQWSHWGTTFLINKESFPEDTKYVKIVEHLNNLNFVKNTRAKSTQCIHDVILVDHGNRELRDVAEQIESKISDRTLYFVKYEHSYLNTLKDFIDKLPESKDHYLWICSSVCDYSNFDFSYVVDPFSRESLHVFPSGSQKYGDTFFINVNHLKNIFSYLYEFEAHPSIKFNNDLKTVRLPEPVIITDDDTHVNAIKQIDGFPYATIVTADNKDIEALDVEPINLWSTGTKNIIITSTGATRIVAPKETILHVKKELYDYPYIKRAPKLVKSNPLDIVYLSNGEPGAEENYEHLLKVAENLPNRVVRVDGINGRAAAYHAAANASNTPWFFTVFAKLKVNEKFDWSWQPDRMQVPKHYIFHAKNPVNGLVYGHQAMIAYNKKLTLANSGRGLDFTLDDEHEVVPLMSGTANYNTDAYSTWRTAFREVLKLCNDFSEDSRNRLEAWLTIAEGDFAEYSIMGANDAKQYHDEVNGDFDALKLSYEWDWLKKKFDGK